MKKILSFIFAVLFATQLQAAATDFHGRQPVVAGSAGQVLINNGNNTTSAFNLPAIPGGRLSPSSSLPIPTTDATALTTLYYLPFTSQLAPIYNGTAFQWYDIGSSGLSLILDSTHQVASEVFDVYLFLNGTTPTLCAEYWGSGGTARSTTAGGFSGTANSSVTQINGLYVNNAAIASGDCYNNSVSYALPINQATLLGTIQTSGTAGKYNVNCTGAGASGGNFAAMYVSNVYNKIRSTCHNNDTATAVTTSSASWAALGSGDKFSWVDSTASSPIGYTAFVIAGNGTAAGDIAQFGVSLDSTTATPKVIGASYAGTATLGNNYQTISVSDGFLPQLGTHYIVPQIAAPAGTATYMPVTTYENFSVTLSW